MGRGMALNLLEAGHEVTVWNRTADRAIDLVTRGAVLAPTVAAAVAEAEFVLYCLSDDAAVRSVVLGPEGLAALVPTSAIVVDPSTISPQASAEQREAFELRGVRFIDAPVFGSKGEAEAGGLWVVAGGEADVMEGRAPRPRRDQQFSPPCGRAGRGCAHEARGQPRRRLAAAHARRVARSRARPGSISTPFSR